ncbi:fimbria/pilus outer membrane usher protein [Enterobacter sp. CC120223-11]|uniref:fimbria/pilus outer membrane usher protein n=1 Tax=Enterobacter sp. CC120223-11 TaxID=1378073 RepID=UPI000BC397F5|nr:fimbria/pilus outer membrane usher protein [Enterobacter sp. CC120223-11]SNY80312.1 outer membrane usher protein [Enterobacter sp. CC120223-11]
MQNSKFRYYNGEVFAGKLSPLVLALFCLNHPAFAADTVPPAELAKNLEFSSSFLQLDDQNAVDLSRYANGGYITPGTYSTAVYVNGMSIGTMDVTLRERKDKTVYPCMTDTLLRQIPFRYDHLPDHFFDKSGECGDLKKQLPEAVTQFDSSEMSLHIQLPQLYVSNNARGSVSPELWDSGIPAVILGYNLNGYQSTSGGYDSKSLYAGINAGLNVGAWYFRHNGSYNWDQHGKKKYDAINTYVQRDIPFLRARALAGQANTRGDVFDTLPFTGVKLATDERMLPESRRGYAPEIRGIAHTNAKVTVRQSGAVIYQTTVAPGAFLIDDLYPSGYGGDLQVTVEEADGRKQIFNVPFASVVEQLRPGATRYEIVGGNLRNDYLSNQVALYQGTIRHGFTNWLTGYGGMQLSQNYYAILGGAAVGTPVGSFSFDVTQARMHLPGTPEVTSPGQSYRLSYSETVNSTSLSVAAYRFSSSGFMDFMTAQQTVDAMQHGGDMTSVWRSRSRYSITASQALPENWGQLYISGSVQDYWNKNGSDKQYQIGYNNSYGSVSYGLSAGRTYSRTGSEDTYLLTVSLPLGRSDSSYRPQLSMQMTHDSNGRTGEQATVSGTGGEDHQLSYTATAMNSNQGGGQSGALNAQYRTPYSDLSVGWSGGKNYHSESLGASGTLVAHSGGVTMTPYTSDTFALIEAKGATGASVSGYPGVHIDRFGYALVPYLDPYQMNEIILDPKGASDDLEMTSTEKKIAPYYGAVVKVKYGTKTGTPLLVNATLNGEPVPFGADVLDEQGRSVGSVGQGGQLYARVEQEQGALRIRWGKGSSGACQIRYHLMPMAAGQKRGVQTFNSVCEPLLSRRSTDRKLLAMQDNPRDTGA